MPKKAKKHLSELDRDIEFLYEIGSLRFMSRTWIQFLQTQVANNAEHIFRVIWIALVIARHEGAENEEKIIKMALLHDIAESRTPDTNYISKIYSTRDEPKALHHMISDTVLRKEFEDLFAEYERRDGIEAKIVKDADNLDVDFELSELRLRGHQIQKNLIWKRTNVRKKFYTKTAGKIWDEIQTADPVQWHATAHNLYTAEKDRK
ncbi:MAG TPA: HD domain-containing protein [Patescibacteria group bacterium]|nr:HD domain-containing protein [Patescibacteria group bacterium]